MMMTDVSTPLNRATTIAPIMSAFSAGTALGPALGGFLVDTVGLHPTFYLTGACFMGVAALNRVIMQETKPKPIIFPWQESQRRLEDGQEGSVWSSTQKAMAQWAPLLENPGIKSVLIMNGMYWVALAGAQMTLLPLILTDANGLAMSAMQVGQVYAAMSLVQIFGNPVFAKVADRVGKAPAILAGCGLVSASMAGVSVCETYTDLSFALGLWAVGSSMLSTAPVAYISDKVSTTERAQALALLRTCGDVGFLVGASSIGMLADYSGLDGAMQCSAGVLASATMWFATRHNITARLSALLNK
jgi:MFS family permease